MRIQETNSILKESRYARREAQEEAHDEGKMSRLWRSISSIPHKLTDLVRRH